MKFAATFIEKHPNGTTVAVEVRCEAADGDAASPVMDTVLAVLTRMPVAKGAERHVTPPARVQESLQDYAEQAMEAEGAGVFGWSEAEAAAYIALDQFNRAQDAVGVADDDGMRRDSRE